MEGLLADLWWSSLWSASCRFKICLGCGGASFLAAAVPLLLEEAPGETGGGGSDSLISFMAAFKAPSCDLRRSRFSCCSCSNRFCCSSLCCFSSSSLLARLCAIQADPSTGALAAVEEERNNNNQKQRLRTRREKRRNLSYRPRSAKTPWPSLSSLEVVDSCYFYLVFRHRRFHHHHRHHGLFRRVLQIGGNGRCSCDRHRRHDRHHHDDDNDPWGVNGHVVESIDAVVAVEVDNPVRARVLEGEKQRKERRILRPSRCRNPPIASLT
jgi:hypothetical protein